jgi:hypothetical protein
MSPEKLRALEYFMEDKSGYYPGGNIGPSTYIACFIFNAWLSTGAFDERIKAFKCDSKDALVAGTEFMGTYIHLIRNEFMEWSKNPVAAFALEDKQVMRVFECGLIYPTNDLGAIQLFRKLVGHRIKELVLNGRGLPKDLKKSFLIKSRTLLKKYLENPSKYISVQKYLDLTFNAEGYINNPHLRAIRSLHRKIVKLKGKEFLQDEVKILLEEASVYDIQTE